MTDETEEVEVTVEIVEPLTDAEMAELERKVGKAKSLLILDHPFFGAAVSRRPIRYSYNVPTACMYPNGQMDIGPHFANKLSVKNLMFLLAHEAMHYMLAHGLRRKHRDPRAWNVAADKVINDTLIDAGIGEFIDGGVTLDGGRHHAAEELYDENEQGNGGIGNGDIGAATDENGKPLDESQINELQAKVQIETLQAAKAAKAMGKLPASIERIVDEIVNVKTPWHEILERYMQSKVKDGYSWNRPNRRFISRGIYLPGNDFIPKMGKIVVGVDTSGSIGQRELSEFNGHVDKIIDSCNPDEVIVVYCDAEVNAVDEFTRDDYPVRLRPVGGGGTAFEPVFDYVREKGIDPEVVVYLTDGYGNTHFEQPAHDTVWLTTGSESFDWGTVIKFEPEE